MKLKIYELSFLVKYVLVIFVVYICVCVDFFFGFIMVVRKDFELGLYVFCNLIIVGGWVNVWGREGEGFGIFFGLGEGFGGDGEKEFWVELWFGWSKGRYMG